MSPSLELPDEKKVDAVGDTTFVETVRREGTDAENLVADARAATEAEHKLTLMQGLRRYPKAVAWSLLISTCIMLVAETAPFPPLGRVLMRPLPRRTSA